MEQKIVLMVSISIIIGLLALSFAIASFVRSYHSKNNFQTASSNYCMPCSRDTAGKSTYTNTDGGSVNCNTIEDWLIDPQGGGRMGLTFTPNGKTGELQNYICTADQSNKLLEFGGIYKPATKLAVQSSYANVIDNINQKYASLSNLTQYITVTGNQRYTRSEGGGNQWSRKTQISTSTNIDSLKKILTHYVDKIAIYLVTIKQSSKKSGQVIGSSVLAVQKITSITSDGQITPSSNYRTGSIDMEDDDNNYNAYQYIYAYNIELNGELTIKDLTELNEGGRINVFGDKLPNSVVPVSNMLGKGIPTLQPQISELHAEISELQADISALQSRIT